MPREPVKRRKKNLQPVLKIPYEKVFVANLEEEEGLVPEVSIALQDSDKDLN